MTPSDYRKLSQNLTEDILETQALKQTEYVRGDEDVLRQLKAAADLQGITPLQALLGMMSKHTVSLYDILGEDDCLEKNEVAAIFEKIVDHVNYLYLAWAMVNEGPTTHTTSFEEIATTILRAIGITPEVDDHEA